MAEVRFSGDACDDLRRIGDPTVVAELLYLARCELRPPQPAVTIEGLLEGHPDVWWRRGVRLNSIAGFESFSIDGDVDDFQCQACDYVLVYRAATSDERIKYRIGGTTEERSGFPKYHRVQRAAAVLMVVRVFSNQQLVRHISALPEGARPRL